MLLPDVTQLLDDPALGGGVKFTVYRTTRSHSLIVQDEETTETFEATGNIQPSGSESLQQITPEDRKNVVAVCRTKFTFSIGGQTVGGQVDPDKVVYNGKAYRVLQVENWSDWGFTVGYLTLDKGGVSNG